MTENFTNPLNKERNKANRPPSVHIRMGKKMLQAIDNVSEQSGMTRTEWVRGAILRGLKNWKSPLENATIWGPCRHCGHKHDPSVHGVDE